METLEDDFNHLKKAQLLLAIDHARAGNGFFKRIFDLHPEILTIPSCGYIYHSLCELFVQKKEVPWQEAHDFAMQHTNMDLITLEMTPEIERDSVTRGDDPLSIDRKKVAEAFREILKRRGVITRKDMIISMHLSYAYGMGRNPRNYSYLLLDDSVTGLNDRFILKHVQSDFLQYRVISLIRDPRASFASLRHQIVNQFGTMYPLRAKQLWKIAGCNAIWLWILCYTTAGAQEMSRWRKELGTQLFYEIRNEDWNLNFVETIRKLMDWLGCSWHEKWENPDWTPTCYGIPWKGASAYSDLYKTNTNGPFKNDSSEHSRIPAPSRINTERWKKHLLQSEVRWIEAVYENEMREHEYPFSYLSQGIKKKMALLWIFLPLAGELPGWEWLKKIRKEYWVKDCLTRLSYYPLFPFFYALARIRMIYFLMAGKLKTSVTSQGSLS